MLEKKNCFIYVFRDMYFQLSYLSMDKGNLHDGYLGNGVFERL